MADPKDPSRREYATGVLSPAAHSRIVADIDRLAAAANIPSKAIWTSIQGCRPIVKAYLHGFADIGNGDLAGVVLTQKRELSFEKEMFLIAGAFLRNFIGAKVMSLQALLRELEEGTPPDERVLLIPDFYVEDVKIAAWKLGTIRSFLLDRICADKQTILGVQTMELMRRDYGAAVNDFIIEHFMIEEKGSDA